LTAGCAANELHGSDYGFDIHVLLPEKFPGDAAKWPMTSQSVLVQVKGGRSFDRGVALSREMWRFYLRSTTPVYLAVVPTKGRPWIELVDRLASSLDTPLGDPGSTESKAKQRFEPDEADRRWNPQLFVEDAILHAALGVRSRRRLVLDWADHRVGSEDEEYHFLDTLAELAVAEGTDFAGIDERVAGYLEYLPGLVYYLRENGTINQDFGMPDLSALELGARISGGDYLEADGGIGPDAVALGQLLREVRPSVTIRDFVLLADREHFSEEDHFFDRNLARPEG
jgi:hypothetical protein